MPRLNDVFMSGLVAEYPEIKYDETQKPLQAAIEIVVIHGDRDYGDNIIQRDIHVRDISHYGTDSLWVVTSDPVQIDIIRTCKPYDLILVKGTLRIKDIKKRTYCPTCRTINLYRSRKHSIYPIFFKKLESIGDRYGVKKFDNSVREETEMQIRRDAFQELRNINEISNSIHLIGAVCEDPTVYREDGGKIIMSFPLAVKRKYFIVEDDMRINVDFPYIKLYGGKAKAMDGKIKKGNLLMIDGFINTRTFDRKLECESCHNVFLAQDYTAEVVGYSIENLRNDVSDVEKEEEDNPLAGIKTHAIGSEADIGLRQKSMEAMMEEKIASGYKVESGTSELIEAVKNMKD